MLGSLYFAAATVSVLYTRFDGGAAFIWPSGAIALGTLVSSDRHYWVERLAAFGIASFATTSLFSLRAIAAIPLSVINLCEVVLGAILLRRLQPDFGQIASAGETVAMIAIVGVVAPVIASFGGALIVTAYTPAGYWTNWIAWYAGHALGMVMLTPLVVLMFRGEVSDWVRGSGKMKQAKAGTIFALLAITAFVVFGQDRLPLLFLPFAVMVGAVLLLGRLGATLSVLVLAGVGIAFTIAGHGPIAAIEGSDGMKALVLQVYLATAVLTVLPVAGDLRKRKHSMKSLEGETALYRLILDGSGDLIITLDREGIVRFASPSARSVVGVDAEALIGTAAQAIIHPEDLLGTVRVHRDALQTPAQTCIVAYRICIDGSHWNWFESRIRAMQDDAGDVTGLVCIVRDISHQKEIERTLTDVAMTDAMTNIANRRAFDDVLEKRLGNGGRSSDAVLALFDLDHFKLVNDRYGHAAGDRVLQHFATILKGELRARDMPARIGGEEFAAIIDGNLEIGQAVCERIRIRLTEAWIELDDGRSIQVTVSAGAVALPQSGMPGELLARADRALYQAKRAGRNQLGLAA